MTTAYSAQLSAATSSPIWLVEIVTDKRCANTYASAVAPSTCTASDLGDGARCYYSRKTCQDTANFRVESFTWRLISADVQIPATYFGEHSLILPVLANVSQTAQQVDIFEGLQRTDKMKITCHDLGGDVFSTPPFDTDKSVRNTGRAGSYWRRWLAQWPNFRNMRVTVKRGFSTSTFADADFATVWKGKLSAVTLLSNGGVSFECVDLAADLDRKIPAAISTTNTIQADISRTATSITVLDASEFTDPTVVDLPVVIEIKGISGNVEYAQVTARDTGTNTLTVTRGVYGTDSDAARVDTKIREVLVFARSDGTGGVAPLTAVQNILTHVGIADADVDTTTFSSEAVWVGPGVVRRIVVEPTPAKELIQSILELFQGVLYVTESSQISVHVNRPLDLSESTTAILDTENMIAGSVKVNYLEDKRRTHIVVYYDFPTETGTDVKDARGVVLAVNGETYVATYFGVSIEDKFQSTFKSRWIGPWDSALAADVGISYSTRWAFAPAQVMYNGWLRDAAVTVGTIADVTAAQLEDAHGAQQATRMTIIGKKSVGKDQFAFTAEQTGFPSAAEGGKRYTFLHAAAYATDYDGATSTVQDSYAFVADDNETLGSVGDAGDYLF